MDFKEMEGWAGYRRTQNNFTFEDSILAKFSTSKQKYIVEALSFWLYKANLDFDGMKEDILELSFIKSINELELAKMELRELNRFFETGQCNSMLVQVDEDALIDYFTEKELYENYLSLLRGNYQFFITEKAYLKYEQEITKHDSQLIKAGKIPSINECLTYKSPYCYTKNVFILFEQWQITARVQALLWIKKHLEHTIKTEIFTNTTVSIDDLFKAPTKKGFQVANPNKTIPALYHELTKNSLIKDEGLDCFKQAFENGESTITWLKIQGQLSYFIQQLKNKGITLNNDNWKTASCIFIVNGKCADMNSLKAGASGLTEKHKNLIENIINQTLSIN